MEHQVAYRIRHHGPDGMSIDAYYRDEEDALDYLRATAEKDGWELTRETDGQYPVATDDEMYASMSTIRLRADFDGLPGGEN